ncbi:MAG: SpaA isopeptide-forming pilin-related protein [Anaerococcus vaginalis]|uniref:SpaA isopeptide-forming pilin-related protein n=1 Tax=Anaerococcus vaginalis TaxID=33037 RepID=UPI002914069E|nr:SpaA isopeptide-forming pilin-related protein [Anaerococcus vaginalis]MDU5086452.1 SpaA isopeptide-forming pilin-related protein [Anaerococcus vaginalis]
MKKILRKMMSFVMAVFMVLQVMLPAFASSSKAEEEKPNSIKGLEEMKDDTDVYFSILKSQEIYDKSKKKKDENKFSIAISMPDTTSQFRLIKRNDLKLYEDGYFDTNEKASKEYWRVKDMLNSQGLDLDLEIIKEDQGYKIVTKDQLEKLEEDENKNIYGQNYSYIDLKIMDDFDFNEKGIQKLFDEDKLLFNLEFIKYTSLDPDFELYEKDENGNLKIKNQGDLFALIREDKIKLYNTNSLEEDYNKLKAYKEEKQTEQQKAKDKKEQENALSQSQEEKVQDEKSSSNKENLSQDKKEQKNKEDTKENKESNTEVQVESKENTKEKTENKDNKDSAQEPKKEEQKEKSSQKNQTQEKSEDKKEKKTTEKKGLLPKLRMLFLGQDEPAKPKLAKANANALADKKFTINTRFDTSNAGGPIKKDQYFIIHLDEKLKVNDPSTLKPVKHNGQIIAEPEYEEKTNSIKYKIIKDINDNIQEPLSIEVDYNTDKITIGDDGTFTVTNRVSGPGVKAPKNLVPQKIDKNGNPAGSIIEPDRDDVIKIIDDEHGNYQVPIDITGEPVVENGEMVGINWNMKVHADQSLSALGFMANFTTVEGSGLGEIEKVLLNGKEVTATDQLKDALGIVDSKHHKVTDNTQEASYSFYTKVTNKQEKYMIDISVFLKQKGKAGAVRFVLDQGYPKEKIEEATPTRVGINNRTTIQGKFLANDKAQWTITDAISSGDEKNGGMPLADRTLDGDQTVKSGNSAVYGLDENGNMVVKENQKAINSIPSKETDPQGTQAVGNIAVYKLDTQLTNSDKPSNYNISGVRISKFRDLYIDQVWNFPVDGMTMPGQKFIAKDKDGKNLGEVHVDEGTAGETTRFATIPNARYWDIDETSHKPSKRENKIEQKFDQDTVQVGGKTYKYNENANYYQIDTKSQYIHNSAIEQTTERPVTFTVVKVDSKDPSKKLAGAKFKLLGDNQPSIITDSQGKATFNNVLPGRYTLVEEKAPAGYKLDQSQKTINISKDGDISVDGSNIQLGGGKSQTKLVQHDSYPNWPDYMNAMHYGKISDNGDLEFYLYLKPQSNNGAGGTNRNTRLNISIPGVNITDVTAYDVSPGYRNNVKYSMEEQNVDGFIPLLGNNVINVQNNNVITGTPNKTDAYTGKTGYQIHFPQERFAGDWGFLVKVKANIGAKQSVSLDYDWLTDEDTANQTNLTQKVALSKSNGADEPNQLIVTNEEFTKSPITITKFGDTFDTEGKRNKLQGAEFVLKDSTGKILANKFTNDKGTADFGQYPPGTYRLEEAKAPDGHQKNGVYFEVVVDEQGQVKYNARFEDGNGTPETGRDYYIEKGKETGTSGKAKVTNVNQRLEYLENEPGDIGVQTGVWEAYSYESLKYHADVTLDNSAPGTRFEIQFDRNFDFTQYFSEFPKVVIDGEEVADPYFDYNTNLLTYVFNEKSKGGTATASINLRGIIPDKYYAKETGEYPFTIKVAPGVADVGGNPVLNKTINADYGRHHSKTGDSNQSYYFRDVYQKEDGKWYVTVLTYLNPLGLDYSAKTVKYNWITTDFQSNRIAEWSGKGYKPLYELNDVKVYGTDYAKYWLKGIPLNRYMPLSMGIRPEQEPNIYHLLAHQSINPAQGLNRRENDITIKYDPNQITTSDKLNAKAPLTIQTPKPKDKGGYVVEQTFKITDIEQFNKKWRAFLMNDGNLTSAFASKANVNTAIGDQAGGEIPKYYKEIIGLINHKYTPGSFKLTKYDETNQGKKLQNATFALKDENGKVIYRTSDSNGEVNFDNIAPGRYSLEETRAPKGYQLTNKKWQVTILNDGSVRIRETSVTGESKLYTGDNINIQVSNRPAGQKFRVYKKDGDGRPLPGAKFKISDPDNNDPNFPIEATSDQNGIVEFNGTPQENKNYVLEEVEPPKGYNKLNKKWVLRVEGGKVKIYNYSENAEGGQQVQSILGKDGVEWVDVKNRNTSGWSNYDNRWTGWAGNNQNAQFLGTRIVGINKKDNYVIQRYVINPEARNIADKTTASIHRQALNDPNMDWFNENNFDKTNDIKIFKLDKPVTGLISDIRLANYKAEDISASVTKTTETARFGEPNRLKLDIPATDKPIVIDVKVPYKDANGGVGTGMDWINGNQIYWKADFYERVYDIKTTGPTTGTTGTILGSYVGEDSLDVTNDIKTYGFKLKKLKEDKTTVIPGAVFKLTGPEPLKDERFMTTGKDGMISFNGLKPGKYKLEEEKPAPGYENPNTTWTVRVASDGKVYIKDENKATDPKKSSVTVSTNANIARNNLMRRLQIAGANTDLEISGNLVDTLNPLRAGNGWEVVDNASSTQPKMRQDYSDSDYDQLIDTKIIEIDKANNRYKQVFIYKQGVSAKRNREIKFHRAYGNYGIMPSEVKTRVFQVPENTSLANINESSDIDKISSKTDISSKIRFTSVTEDKINKIKTTNITTLYPGTILIEVETNYIENQPIGLGSNYDFNTSSQSAYGHKCWLEKSYANEAGVPVVKTTVNHTITFDGNGGKWHMDPVTVEDGSQYELPGSSFIAPEGKVFDYWLVNREKKNPGDRITVTSDLTIQAQWRDKAPEQVTISFSAGEGSGTMADEKVNVGSNYTLPANGFNAPTGKEFKAWLVNGVEYQPGATIPVNADTTITALWKEKAPETYNVIVQKPQEGGTITAEPTSATAGTQINLTVTPNEGYEIESVTMNGQTLTADTDGKYKFKMPASNATVSATFKQKEEGPSEGEIEIPSDGFAQITNKQTGLDLKIYKKASNSGNKLEGALFTIKKTDENFQNPDTVFGTVKGKSNADGLVEFKDKDGNLLRLPVGYYLIEETAAPLGYRKPNAPWKVQVVEKDGKLVAKYIGPEETPQSFIEKNKNLEIKNANGVKYATKITHIDTESRSFIQRVYIDTRGKQGTVNVQITPKHKREEIDRAGKPPVTIKEGVKTAYRSTYKISGINGDPDQAQMIKILNDYDVATPNVTVVNTARWRPFDWGFDEDQLNLEPGVYYIDIEGFYDTSIIDRNVTNEVRINNSYNFIDKTGAVTDKPVLKDPYKLTENDIPDEDLGKIDIDIKFFDGAREFKQQVYNSKTKEFESKKFDGASYQGGIEALRQWYEDKLYTQYINQGYSQEVSREYAKKYADKWSQEHPDSQKYQNFVSKKAKINQTDTNWFIGGMVSPSLGTPSSTISTSMDINSLYSSNKSNVVPQEGLDIENDAERYNITFSKHGKETDTSKLEDITKKRLEGAVFKLEKRVREGIYEELEGSYVSSAFNGYFGFRGLEPGRYRLVEVQAPKGYKPINGPLLYFSVETVSLVSQKIVDPRTGEAIDVNTVEFYFPNNATPYKFENLEVHDPVTNEVIKFMKAKNVDLDTTKIIDPTDSTKKTEVSLKDLSIKFPGEIKNKEGETIKDTYKISEIQITPTSNGYISLEYDKANGVYQYIKEDSTTEKDGLLVDYVTSATAKNMGKIVNEKPGQGEITIKKIDQKGDAIKATNQLPGAKFRITNKETGKTEDGTVGADGTLKFTGLNIGHYRLEEIESPSGYINNKQVWNFTVGGEDLDPYAKDAPNKRKDVSSSIKLSESKLSVLNPDSKNKGLLSDNQEEMHPHFGEVFEFDNKYTIDSNLKINPGDYFVLKLSDNIDLHGIMETDISNLDIIADGVGTIAKADYNRKEGTITYTFTNYADTYNLVEFSNKLKAYINLNEVPKAGQQSIERGVVGHKMIKDNINVVYDSMTARELYQGTDGKMYEMTRNHLNLGSKIIKFNPDTGEFVHYYYVNRDRSNTPRSRFYYSSDQDIENLNIDYYYLDSNANLDELMPLSFGVNEDDPRLPEPVRIRSRSYLGAGQEESIGFTNGLNSNSSYIIKVTGRVVGEDKDGYVGHGILEMIDNPTRYVTRWDKQYFFRNEATAKANLEIQAVNPENKIKFIKIDQDRNPLEGATFQLFKKNNDGNWDGHGQPITTGKDGIVEYSKLPKGEYQLRETTAPDGYEKLEGAILEFEVDASGNIHRSKGTNATTDPNKQPVYVDESGSIAMPIVNKKPQKIQFEKVDASEKTTKLEGAEFEVWYKDNEIDEKYTTQLKVYKKTVDNKTEMLVLKEGDNVPAGYTHVEGDKFVTGKDGLVEFNVLDNGYYALKEVKAPKGYIKPRDIVKEFVVKDGKIQEEKFKTEMDVKKTTGLKMANDVFKKSYTTNMTLRFNPNHEDITYVKDNSKITLSNLPLKSEIWDNKFNAKEPLSITAYLVDGDNKEFTTKKFTLDLTKDYDTSYKGSKTIDLYSLVKELENQTTDGDIKSNKTIVLTMSTSLYLKSELDIKSNIVIGDKINEDRTFHIETKGDEYVDHSYKFTKMKEIDSTKPIEIENRKLSLPFTRGIRAWIGFTIIGLVLMILAAYYYNKKKNKALEIEKN